MGYEVDFLAVGTESQSGDAIAIRLWEGADHSRQAVIVVDGGFADSGTALVKHIRDCYGTPHVDLVVSTHPDGDHSSGLKAILEECTVGALWMHQPWNHTHGISDYFKNGRVTDAGVRRELKRSLEDAFDLETLARQKGIPIAEPFTGLSTAGLGATIQVLGPTQAYYESLLPLFRGTPEPVQAVGSFQKIIQAAGETVRRVAETWGIETLNDAGETSAENNSSAILLLTIGTDRLLFTGDAGIPALHGAAGRLGELGVGPANLSFVQVPHHGSQRNVGPAVLTRLLGPRQEVEQRIRTAFVSAARGGKPKHPSKRVMNAFRRRGSPVHGTDEGQNKWHRTIDAPPRSNYVDSIPHPLYNEVDD
jgi:beta-lactamase superfamily II metal-dependent hydrolase